MDSMKWGMDSMDWGMDSILFRMDSMKWGMDSILFVDGLHIFFIPFFHKSPLRSMWAGFI